MKRMVPERAESGRRIGKPIGAGDDSLVKCGFIVSCRIRLSVRDRFDGLPMLPTPNSGTDRLKKMTVKNTAMKNHKAHPWHGIDPGENLPEEVTAFIEIVPTDTVKYEIDKKSGYLKIDRPQKYSNIVPALYGFIPRTFSGARVAQLTDQALGTTDTKGDGDPLDICVLTEKDVTHGDIIVQAVPIGGFRLLDQNEADDKIIAVLKNDVIYGRCRELAELPQDVVQRLVHYFTTYKDLPSDRKQRMQLTHIYDAETAHEVIRCSVLDYEDLNF